MSRVYRAAEYKYIYYSSRQMAEHYPFDNEESEDERAEEEVDENSLAARDTWFGIANATGHNLGLQTQTQQVIRYVLKQKKRYYLGIFPNMGGGLPKSQNFCKFTKYFFVCQIHSEVLKHVLQRGGW